MINSEINPIELGANVAGTNTFHKLPVLSAKKVALRDVQNNNSNITRATHPESLLPIEGQSFVDADKTCGTKRLTPDYASPPLLSNNGAHEHFNHPRRKYELEGNRGRNLGSTEKIAGHPRPANVPQVQQEASQINGKNMHYGSFVAPNHIGSKTSVPRFKESNDDQRTERFIRLQNFIKQCDGFNHRENIQLLLHLSPLELSKHAVELEKRAIQLTIEEGKEMQRVQALNILGKPSSTRTPMPITQDIQHKS
ncbi:hypothetical protein OSB04_017838 [Centaurea solstitialis]|uniref:Uncharacterized protein n=1 Tax=Centaurea solstitialis TaxID=347529 RepID=A0AA38TNL8_9ASTR|nr:hypothetical protein OSB04_017838 [Centaurea solstitialis]